MSMLSVSIALMVLGAAFLFAEAMTPGFAVLGGTGVGLLIISAVLTLFFIEGGVVLFVCEVSFLTAGVIFFVRRIKRKQLMNQLILTETLNEDTKDYVNLEGYIGKTGMSKTSLRPAGTVDLGGATLEAVSDGAYIPENTKIIVKEVSGGKLVVKIPPENQN